MLRKFLLASDFDQTLSFKVDVLKALDLVVKAVKTTELPQHDS